MRERFEQDHPSADFTLMPSSGGVFEISVDGNIKWSKKAEGRFPTDDEVEAIVGAA